MYRITTVGGAVTAYNQEISEAIAGAFRTLLETKHLYQSVTIDADAVRQKLMPRISSNIKSHVVETGSLNLDPAACPWVLPNEAAASVTLSAARRSYFSVMPTHCKMFCSICGRREPYNVLAAFPLIANEEYNSPSGRIEQVYSLTYLCQSCKRFPEAFIVRRAGGKLTLSGRSPMEHVEVPGVIPKDIKEFYSGSVIAYQSGQTLAGLFMLRTAQEQWARKWAGPIDKADQALDKYMADLPIDFKSRFPSFKDMYGQISADIHKATGSSELFDDMRQKFEEHFDARRVFKLIEPV